MNIKHKITKKLLSIAIASSLLSAVTPSISTFAHPMCDRPDSYRKWDRPADVAHERPIIHDMVDLSEKLSDNIDIISFTDRNSQIIQLNDAMTDILEKYKEEKSKDQNYHFTDRLLNRIAIH